MELKELAEVVLPSETYSAVTFDPETHEIGIQYGNVLISIPKEDLSDFLEMLTKASSKMKK
ncbi:hypothetical protein HY229_03150 [Candidatus Acetothermia bacterium]|nr:hypothetical protein [Candidatus Acetothermia bacterium]MBI3643081.1 hypothetical protein [Candidatus Acetothermia bacterium]